MKIACVAGAQPNCMKIAPILEEMKGYQKGYPQLYFSPQEIELFNARKDGPQ
jgi:UDP-N-acetylglucosamine 2-epimerase